MREKKDIQYKLDKNERLLIGFSIFHGLSQLFLGTFVVSFLIHISVNEILSVSLYNLFFYTAIMLTFVFMVDKCKRGNIKVVFGSHIIVQIFLVFLIAFLGKSVTNWVMLLGALYGVQWALYEMSAQQIIIDKVSAERMMFFYGTDLAVTNIAKIVIPVVLGALITVGSLQNIAWVMVVMGLIELVMLFALSSSPTKKNSRADLIGFMKYSINLPCIRKLFFAEFLRGLAYVLETVGIIYIVDVFHTDMNLGIWTTVFAILTATATWLCGRFCSKRDFKWVIILSSVLLMSATIYLMFDVNRFSTIAFCGTLALSIKMLNQVCNVNVLNLAKTKFITRKYRAEYLAARQVIAFIGRWGGILSLLYIGVSSGYKVLPYLIVILVSAKIIASLIYVQIGKYTDGA